MLTSTTKIFEKTDVQSDDHYPNLNRILKFYLDYETSVKFKKPLLPTLTILMVYSQGPAIAESQ